MVTATRFRELALGLEGAIEVPHFDRAAFRTKRRIFATLPPDGASANLLLDLEVQAAVCEALAHAFAPVHGGWGRMGYTTVDLGAVREVDLVRVLAEAHARASEPARTKTKVRSRAATQPRRAKRAAKRR